MAQVAATLLPDLSAPGQLTAARKTVAGYVYDASVVAVWAGRPIAPAAGAADAFCEVLLVDGSTVRVNAVAGTLAATLTGLIAISDASGRLFWVKPAHCLRVEPVVGLDGAAWSVVHLRGLQLTAKEDTATLIGRLNA